MGGHGGVNILGQKSWHVWRMDNRLRVERDEMQAEAEDDAERRETNTKRLQDRVELMKRVNRGEAIVDEGGDEVQHPLGDVSDPEYEVDEEEDEESMDKRKRRRRERERKMKAFTLGQPLSSGAAAVLNGEKIVDEDDDERMDIGASSSNAPPARRNGGRQSTSSFKSASSQLAEDELTFQEELRKERAQKRRASDMTRDERLWHDLEKEAKGGKSRGKGKNRLVSEQKFKETKHINFFEDEEKALFQHEQEFRKRVKYQEKNNDFVSGRDGKTSKRAPVIMSEFDICAAERPWYLNPEESHTLQVQQNNLREEQAAEAARTAKLELEKGSKALQDSAAAAASSSASKSMSKLKKEQKDKSTRKERRAEEGGGAMAIEDGRRRVEAICISSGGEAESKDSDSSESSVEINSSDSDDTRKLKKLQIKHQKRAKKIAKKLGKKKKKDAKKAKKREKRSERERKEKVKSDENARKREKLREMRIEREREERSRAAGIK